MHSTSYIRARMEKTSRDSIWSFDIHILGLLFPGDDRCCFRIRPVPKPVLLPFHDEATEKLENIVMLVIFESRLVTCLIRVFILFNRRPCLSIFLNPWYIGHATVSEEDCTISWRNTEILLSIHGGLREKD